MENLHFVIWFRDYQSRYRLANAADKERPATVDNSTEGNHSGSSSTSLDDTSGHASPQNTSPNDNKGDFRKEVDNILATFFVPNARKELLLSAELRDRVIISAKQSTDPGSVRQIHSITVPKADNSCIQFSPAYKVICESLESVSLPRFLAYAATNINRPRQLFWYASISKFPI